MQTFDRSRRGLAFKQAARNRRSYPVRAELLESRWLLSAITVMNLSDSGPGSLRQAILDANAAGGADSIGFAPGLAGAIVLSSGQLEINGDLSIDGGGAITVDGGGASRVFQIDAGSTATLSRLTIRNGQAPVGGNGGGITSAGTLTLARVTLTGNHAGGSNSPVSGVSGSGGGIFSSGALTVTDSTISGNFAGDGLSSTPPLIWGDPGGWGGGIESTGTLLLTRSALIGNRAGNGGNGGDAAGTGGLGGAGGCGGGLALDGGSGTITDCTFANNLAGNGGTGGVAVVTSGGGGAGGSGGGIVFATGSLSLVNVTISGNQAQIGGQGGAGQNPGLPGPDGVGGGIVDSGTAASFGNTIIASNFASTAPDAAGAASSLGHNLISRTDGSTGWLASDQTGTAATPLDARLAPLGNYGGPTPTLAFFAGSPALDHGDNSLASANGLTQDQRGLSRIFNGTVDIGAYEAQPPTLAGDVNHDGTVNFADILVLIQNYGHNVPVWEDGDLSGDGSINFYDVLVLIQNYGHVGSAASPSSTLLSQSSQHH